MIGLWIKWVVLHTWDVFVLTYVCQLIRSVMRPLAVPPDTRHFIHTFIFAVERCLCQVAMGAFYINGGLVAVFLIRTILGLVWYYMVGRVDVNLCIFIENYVQRKSTIGATMIYTLITYCGFRSVWLCIKLICYQDVLGEYETHCDVVEQCANDLKVAPWLGALVEFATTFLIRFHSLYIEVYPDSQSIVCRIFFVNFITCYGVEYTGSYANPIMAYVLLFHCEGLETKPFLVVYVAAPIIGSLLALVLARTYLVGQPTEESSEDIPYDNSTSSPPVRQPKQSVVERRTVRSP